MGTLADYQQDPSPIGDSLGVSSIFAALPLIVLFVLLGVLRVRAWLAALIGLAVALIVAVAVYAMPVGDALNSGVLGAAFGFFPIMWIVINGIWVYNLTVDSGHFDVLRRSFGSVSDDQVIQAVIIAFCFGALLEALAGFGTPVAICSVMLVALGFQPLKAATIALVANTAPVAFGALATPVTTLATVTALPVDDLGSMVGRQTPVLSVLVPLVLIFIVDGRRGLRHAWPAAVICGLTFGVFQYLSSNFWSIPLADIVASLAAALALLAYTRVRRPARTGAGTSTAEPETRDAPVEILRAYAPYLIIVAVFVIATRVPAIAGTAPLKPGQTGTGLETATRIFSWPALHITNSSGDPVATTFKLNILSAAGTLLLVSGLLTMIVLRIGPMRALRTYGRTLNQLALAIVTVLAVLGLAFVMNEAGETVTLGLWLAGAGGAFAVLSPILGWIGTAVTGSDTSSNSLFGALQIAAAHKANLSPTLLAAANSSGGVLGKMISPQNLAIAAGAVGLQDREGDIFRRVLGWSVVFVVFMCVLVYLQSTSVLSWMVV